MLSFLIPTRNRAESLRITIESLLAMPDFGDAEIVVVDNNSTDHTEKVCRAFGHETRYVSERRLAFSRARATAASEARGDILVFLDDDVTVRPGSADEIRRLMVLNPRCGVIAGRIDPEYEEPPPEWALGCQREFNGWSLFNPEHASWLGFGLQEVSSASGPMMAIRTSAYEEVDGFPPDTVGLETDDSKTSFRKLYVGPGDYGLCEKMRAAGKAIFYAPQASCTHRTPPARFTIAFWRSRMIGEAMHVSVTRRQFFHWTRLRLWRERKSARQGYEQSVRSLMDLYRNRPAGLPEDHGYRMHPDELWFHYHAAYLHMEKILSDNPGLDAKLWKLAGEGVNPHIQCPSETALPEELLHLLADDNMYDDTPIRSIEDLRKRIKGHGILHAPT